ncbi:MAG: ABC-2 family transporter protein [Myxococcales bacterium]|nr:ABC-2 family transporter protein [Myxococcales bacterium]
MSRYLRLLLVQLRASALLAVQYRSDFFIDGVISLFWTATAIVPLLVVFQDRALLQDWSMAEAMVVTGWFVFLNAILEGGINPGLQAVVEQIRKGTLDFVLLKPADSQFLVSTSRFQLWRVSNLLAAAAIFIFAFHRMGRLPSLGGILASALLLVAATAVLYSLWILTVSAAFFVVKVDNLTYLFGSIFDAARWPATVFRGVVRFVFTFVIPLALMTTYPAEALLGRLEASKLLFSLLGAAAFTALARWVWMRSIAHYTSASS